MCNSAHRTALTEYAVHGYMPVNSVYTVCAHLWVYFPKRATNKGVFYAAQPYTYIYHMSMSPLNENNINGPYVLLLRTDT